MSMNEDLPKQNGTDSPKALAIAIIPFYFITVFNFVDFLGRWFAIFWCCFIIVDDYLESNTQERLSMLEMFLPWNKPKAFD